MTRRSLASTLAVGIALAAGAAWGGEATDRVEASAEASVDQAPKLVRDLGPGAGGANTTPSSRA